MTVSEASKKIGVSAAKLYQLASARKISHYRVGGKILFTDDDVAAFLASCRVPIAVAPAAKPQLAKPSGPSGVYRVQAF